MRYQPDLDGLRGWCVAAVFLFHAQFLGCGWLGVQAFFVLSGYLITGVLLDAKRDGGGGRAFFAHFYARRALRIFPVYFVFLAVVHALSGMIPSDLSAAVHAQSAAHAPYLITYTYNFFRLSSGLGSPVFGHLWSLSVEEQFYLFWPLCVYLLSRSGMARLTLALVLAGPFVRLAEATWLVGQDPGAQNSAGHFVYFLTPSVLDAFAAGALLNFRSDNALIERTVRFASKWALPIVLLASFSLLAVDVIHRVRIAPTTIGWPIYLQKSGAYIWAYSLFNLLFLAVIANAGALRPLALAWVQRLGRVSYGFYIFHLPILWTAFVVSGASRGTFTAANLVAVAVAFALTWGLAELSFRILESPFLKLKRRFATADASAPVSSPGGAVSG